MTHDQSRPNDRLTLVYILTLGALVALYRLVPYTLLTPGAGWLWNLAPVGALCLFIGSRCRERWGFLLPLGIMLVSDVLLIVPVSRLGYSSFGYGTPLIYASLTVYLVIGRMIKEGELHPAVIGGAALLAGLQFFIITNFGVWLAQSGTMYPMTWKGLLACYTAALPFYQSTVFGDLLFSGLIFGVHAALLIAVRKERQPV